MSIEDRKYERQLADRFAKQRALTVPAAKPPLRKRAKRKAEQMLNGMVVVGLLRTLKDGLGL